MRPDVRSILRAKVLGLNNGGKRNQTLTVVQKRKENEDEDKDEDGRVRLGRLKVEGKCVF